MRPGKNLKHKTYFASFFMPLFPLDLCGAELGDEALSLTLLTCAVLCLKFSAAKYVSSSVGLDRVGFKFCSASIVCCGRKRERFFEEIGIFTCVINRFSLE